MLNRCTTQNLSVIAWSLATLRYRPNRMWLEHFLKAAAARMEGRAARHADSSIRGRGRKAESLPQCSANLLWALAKLQVGHWVGEEGRFGV